MLYIFGSFLALFNIIIHNLSIIRIVMHCIVVRSWTLPCPWRTAGPYLVPWRTAGPYLVPWGQLFPTLSLEDSWDLQRHSWTMFSILGVKPGLRPPDYIIIIMVTERQQFLIFCSIFNLKKNQKPKLASPFLYLLYKPQINQKYAIF